MNNNIDILSIHNKILKNFETDKENIDTYKKQLKKVKKSLQKNLTYRMKNNLEKSENFLLKKIKDIESNSLYNYYLIETSEIIKKYTDILSKPVFFSFIGKKENNQQEKKKVINTYLTIAQKYIHIDKKVLNNFFSGKKSNLNQCSNCQSTNFQKIENIEICLNCGKETHLSTSNSSYKDSERINMSAKYTYDRKIHFKDCINQYQGKQNVNISPDVYTKLTKQFDLHGLLLKTTDKSKRFSKITKKHVFIFLKELGYSKHYEDIILIHYNLTGKKPNNISHLEPKLLEDFDVLVSLYDRKYKKNNKICRKNFINTQYVLFQLLRRHKFMCKKQDFNILKSNERKSFHDKICKELFTDLGWNFTSTF